MPLYYYNASPTMVRPTATASAWITPTLSWIDSGTATYTASTLPITVIVRRIYEEEQRRQRRAIASEHDKAARERSRELLLAHLTPAQRETFTKHKWFVVEGGLSKERYRIRDAGHMVANIDVLSLPTRCERDVELKHIVSHRLCGHCDLSAVPLYDQLLAQKMMLEYDEERFLKLANRHAA